MGLRRSAIVVHRWLSLFALLFWLLQAVTGVFSVYHWEIDDALVDGARHPTDFRAIERQLAVLAPPDSGRQVSSIWTSAGAGDRWDVNMSDRVVRVDGRGMALRTRLDGERFANGGFVETLVTLHHELLAGSTGRTIVGISGALLLTNILLGIAAAWPSLRAWRTALRPVNRGPRVARLYGWHRAVGLWMAIPALFLVSAGVLMAFEEWSETTLGAVAEAPHATGPLHAGMSDAVAAALARFPDAEVSGVGFPSEENAVWRITLKQRRELRRAYGRTRVFVSAVDGRILGDYDVLRAPRGQRLFHSLFAFHTGEMGGRAGRVVVVLTGLALIALIVFGVSLWFARRRP